MFILNILAWILFGALVGWVASVLMKTRRKGLLRNVVVGLVGAMLGGWIASFFGIGAVGDFSIEGFVIAVLGAMLFIWLLKRFF